MKRQAQSEAAVRAAYTNSLATALMEDSNGQSNRETGLTPVLKAILALLVGLVDLVVPVAAVLMLIWF